MASELSERQPLSGLWPRVDRVFHELSEGGAGSWLPPADVIRREDAIVGADAPAVLVRTDAPAIKPTEKAA